jgi:hypothetical protein
VYSCPQLDVAMSGYESSKKAHESIGFLRENNETAKNQRKTERENTRFCQNQRKS